MAITHLPRHLVIDGFLPEPFLADLVDHAIRQEQALLPTAIERSTGEQRDDAVRSSWKAADSLGPHAKAFRAILGERHEEFLAGLGIAPFAVEGYEMELVAHRDVDFYDAHIDTFTDKVREKEESDRMISAVFYFHRQPKGFTGGELALYPFGASEPALDIEPVCNRLAVFPSFAMHKVRPVRVPGNAFADARFAINCWIHRKRG